MRYQHPVTPAELGLALTSLCEHLVPHVATFYVDVDPLKDAPANECFSVVQTHVTKHGGTRVLGWALWEMPGLFVEAEFHAVWRSPTGEYLDLVPKTRPVARVLFLPSVDAMYEDRQVNNVRRAVSVDPEVERYFRGFDEMFEFMNRGERADVHGEVRLDDAALAEYKEIELRALAAHQAIAHRFPFFGPYLPCWCGSGKKMKWCHKGSV